VRKKRRILIAVLVVVFVGGLAWWAMHPREPVYQGRRLSQWLDEYNRAGAMDKTRPVSEAIRAMGTNTLPFLLANIKRTESPLKEKFFSLIRKQHWIKLSFYGTDPYRETSILALSALGSNAAPICPELLKVAEMPDISWLGTMSLLAIGPAAVPTLARACQSTNAHLRTEAVLMMAMQQVNGPPWFSWGWNKSPVNGQPMFSVGYAVGEREVQVMISLLANPDPAVRHASAEAIGLYTRPPYTSVARSAIGPLTEALKDADPLVRESAAETLKKIDPDAAVKAGIK
jgi:hypothetical protein